MERIEEHTCQVCDGLTDHLILAKGRNPVARCLECGVVHPITATEARKAIIVRTIVSMEATSRMCQVEMDYSETCRLGDHFVAECGEEFFGVEVTAIECGKARLRKAKAPEITTLWTRKVDDVEVRIAIHNGRTTTSIHVTVPGEEPFVVGEVYKAGQRRIRVSRIKVRRGGILKNEGARVEARRIKRIFGYPI